MCSAGPQVSWRAIGGASEQSRSRSGEPTVETSRSMECDSTFADLPNFRWLADKLHTHPYCSSMGLPLMPPSLPGPGSRADQTLSLNMRLIAHHELQGFGGIGEGMAVQIARDGRRILWLAHESAPKNFTGVDVTDPRQSRVVVQTELPHAKVRSNSLDVVGDMMAVAYQTQTPGLIPAGFDLFDIGVPEQPKLVAHFDASGPHSRGVHALWFVDGEFVHMASGAADFQPRHPFDDQFYRI